MSFQPGPGTRGFPQPHSKKGTSGSRRAAGAVIATGEHAPAITSPPRGYVLE
jgi:hypothetical protein